MAQTARVVSATRESWISKLNGVVKGLQVFSAVDAPDGIDFGVVVDSLARLAPRDAIIVTDAGNISTWVHRHWKMTPDNTLIGGIVGAMGLGVPGAVASSLVEPKRTALCFVGDGGVLMTGQEIATAMAYGASPKIVISNNGIYGTIRAHQEREFPGRVSGTNLSNPDFDAWLGPSVPPRSTSSAARMTWMVQFPPSLRRRAQPSFMSNRAASRFLPTCN